MIGHAATQMCRETLKDALHTLSQPLTAVILSVEFASTADTLEEAQSMLRGLQCECERTLVAFEQLRTLVRDTNDIR